MRLLAKTLCITPTNWYVENEAKFSDLNIMNDSILHTCHMHMVQRHIHLRNSQSIKHSRCDWTNATRTNHKKSSHENHSDHVASLKYCATHNERITTKTLPNVAISRNETLKATRRNLCKNLWNDGSWNFNAFMTNVYHIQIDLVSTISQYDDLFLCSAFGSILLS